jgi:AcrR family transcriptional regulator
MLVTEVQDRRDLILTSAAELFARKSIAATTVREIADAVGVLSGSLYHHFESKDAIVAEVLSRYLEVIHGRYSDIIADKKSPTARLHELILVSLQVAEQLPHPTAIYQNELHYLREQEQFAAVHKAASEVQQIWMDVIEAGVVDGSFRADVPPRIFYRLVRDAVWLSVRWHRPSARYSTKRLADDVTAIFLKGFAAG